MLLLDFCLDLLSFSRSNSFILSWLCFSWPSSSDCFIFFVSFEIKYFWFVQVFSSKKFLVTLKLLDRVLDSISNVCSFLVRHEAKEMLKIGVFRFDSNSICDWDCAWRQMFFNLLAYLEPYSEGQKYTRILIFESYWSKLWALICYFLPQGQP